MDTPFLNTLFKIYTIPMYLMILFGVQRMLRRLTRERDSYIASIIVGVSTGVFTAWFMLDVMHRVPTWAVLIGSLCPFGLFVAGCLLLRFKHGRSVTSQRNLLDLSKTLGVAAGSFACWFLVLPFSFFKVN